MSSSLCPSVDIHLKARSLFMMDSKQMANKKHNLEPGFMKSILSPVCRMGRSPAHAVRITLHYQHGQKFAHPTHFVLLFSFFLMPSVVRSKWEITIPGFLK